MNSDIEQGLKQWLLDEGVIVPLYTGLTAEEIDPADQVISCYVPDLEGVVGNLYIGNAQIILATPPYSDTNDNAALALSNHRSVARTIRLLIENRDQNNFANSFNVAADLISRGAYYSGESESVLNGKWVSTFTLRIGVSTS